MTKPDSLQFELVKLDVVVIGAVEIGENRVWSA